MGIFERMKQAEDAAFAGSARGKREAEATDRRRAVWKRQAASMGESLRRRRGVLGLRTDKHWRNLTALQFGGAKRAAEVLGDAWWNLKRPGAASTPVYTERDQKLDPDTLQKTTGLEGAIATFDAVLVTPRKDRDGDILLPDGAEVDPSMPLLWQNMPDMPIGRLVRVLKQSQKLLSARFALADNALARDAAGLAEFGALRMSILFQPIEFEPLVADDKSSDDEDDEDDEDKDGDEDPNIGGGGFGQNRRDAATPDTPERQGWKITRFAVMATGLVSIPSNTDAIITAFSRGKLHSPLMRKWARSLKRKAG